ncbi:hypothetical protein DFR55_101257 [Herbinix hemicellulosilytica]|uniref:Uncharacterized protein n=1 Tax=Herbinix hemicellulosilytica TaxID=1564487 RepID=A0A0H5SG88_HERHM|nr:hypothetical protein [Herbinix hemicellulosilytica]RBP60797.1 hypothetical protein DFR55_101257 [Herbinix hemicellulosilytica]CRZ34484.1 hypothetical protein HHT355_1282 [Herbinix hemicellulosilytica]
MGEKIKNLQEIKIGDCNLIIELNKATFKNGPRYIHIQNNRIRYNFSETEFIEFAALINKAVNKMKSMKNIEE